MHRTAGAASVLEGHDRHGDDVSLRMIHSQAMLAAVDIAPRSVCCNHVAHLPHAQVGLKIIIIITITISTFL